MIDFHSHILYGVDDGSKNSGMSLSMLSISEDEGVANICATPHFITGEYEITRTNYEEHLNNLIEIAKENGKRINIVSGLEIYINPELPSLYREGSVWGLNDTKYLLIELPMEQFPIYTEDVFYELRLMGLVPILAHPERNIKIMSNRKLLENLINQGAMAQITSQSLTGLYGKEVKRFSEELVKSNLVQVIGSDGHSNRTRNTRIKEGFYRIKELNPQLYKWMNNNFSKIISGEDVEPLKVLEFKKKIDIFSIFRR